MFKLLLPGPALTVLLVTATAALPLLKPAYEALIVPLPTAITEGLAVNVTGEPAVGLNVPNDEGLTVQVGEILTVAPLAFLHNAVKLWVFCGDPVLNITDSGEIVIEPLAGLYGVELETETLAGADFIFEYDA